MKKAFKICAIIVTVFLTSIFCVATYDEYWCKKKIKERKAANEKHMKEQEAQEEDKERYTELPLGNN